MNGKAALVTGGGTRLGLYFATMLAHEGYDVALHYNSSAEGAERAAEEIRSLGRQCRTFACDFSNGDPLALVARVHEAFPGLELLVNSASTYTPAPIAQTDLALLEAQFSVNLFAPMLLTRAFCAQVTQGSVINIIDNKIALNQFAYAAYLLSKKSLAEFTRMAALEFAPRVRVNGVAPGVILPASVRSAEYLEWRAQGIPLKRQGNPDKLGQAVRYLIDNDFVTGQILFVDGGESVDRVGRHSENYPGQ